MVYYHKTIWGDSVLLKQTPSKMHPAYEIKPFKVTHLHGDQMTARREDEIKTRNTQR